jgi:hypothetical protein
LVVPPKLDALIILERWQPELVSSVLHAEDAQQEAIHAKKHATPEEHSDLLGTWILDTGYLERKRDSSEREDAIYISNDQFEVSYRYAHCHLHMAATTCDSTPNWLLKPPAK